jgi:hypothetical protein
MSEHKQVRRFRLGTSQLRLDLHHLDSPHFSLLVNIVDERSVR